jgi:hypothetical protein
MAVAGAKRMVLREGVSLELYPILRLDKALEEQRGAVVEMGATVPSADDVLDVLELTRTTKSGEIKWGKRQRETVGR